VRDWRSEWFYAGNMNPPLEVHSNSPPVVHDNWEKNSLTIREVNSLRPLLDRIGALKLMGLSGAGIVASFLRHRIQPLTAREHLGFEYTGPKDPSRLVDEIWSAVHRGGTHDGRLIGRGARNQEPDDDRDTGHKVYTDSGHQHDVIPYVLCSVPITKPTLFLNPTRSVYFPMESELSCVPSFMSGRGSGQGLNCVDKEPCRSRIDSFTVG
jgi:hypothetical protein